MPYKVIFILLFFLFLRGTGAHIQAQQPPRIADVQIGGNYIFPEDELLSILRTEPNRKFLGVSRLTPWLWFYNWGEKSTVLSDRFKRALQNVGEPPAYLDSTVVQKDVERLLLYYRQQGYQQATVTPNYVYSNLDSGFVRVIFHVEPGRPIYVRQFRYVGLDALTTEQRQLFLSESKLYAGADTLKSYSFSANGQRYQEPRLYQERARVIQFLQNEGYASINRDSIRVIITPFHPDSFDITMQIKTGKRYRVGDIHIEVTGTEQGNLVRHDTLSVLNAGIIDATTRNDSRLKVTSLKTLFLFQPGEWYNQSKVLETKRLLERTGLFSFSSFSTQFQLVNPKTNRLPLLLTLRTQPRRLLKAESFTQRRGGETWEAGIGGSINNINWLGFGEQAQFRTLASIGINFSDRFFTSYQFEVSPNITFPYLHKPFKRIENLYHIPAYNAKTRMILSFLTSRRDALSLIIRARGEAQYQMEIKQNEAKTTVIDVIDFSLSDPEPLPDFEEKFLASIEDDLLKERILEEYTRPQINNAFRYSVRTSTTHPLRRDSGFATQYTLELGGNLPYLIDRFITTPSEIEGSIPGIATSQLQYRQYLRLLADWRRYQPVNDFRVLAWKFAIGLAHPIGIEPSIPFDRRFFLGEASGVRGWSIGQLGPGGSAENIGFLGGDIKLEGSFESRRTAIEDLIAADWILVSFVDAGNIWFGPRNVLRESENARFTFNQFYKQIGIGAGVGIRIAWEYLVLRLDAGWQVHSPIPNTPLFPNKLRPNFHLNIGHTF